MPNPGICRTEDLQRSGNSVNSGVLFRTTLALCGIVRCFTANGGTQHSP